MARNLYLAKDKAGVYLFHGKPSFQGRLMYTSINCDKIFTLKAKSFKWMKIGEIKKINLSAAGIYNSEGNPVELIPVQR